MSDIQTQNSTEINVYCSEDENLSDYDMENTRPGQGTQSHEYEKSTQPMSSFTTAGFTTYCQQNVQQTTEDKFTMENIHTMLQELYKAITEKVVMENAAMFTALKLESTNIKKELEDLRKEVRSTYLSKKIPCDVVSQNKSVHIITNDTPMNTPEGSKTNGYKPSKLSNQPLPENQIPIRPPKPATVPKVPTMASIAATNAPQTSKNVDWNTVSRKKSKNINAKDMWPGMVKNVEEQKRRIVFTRKTEKTVPSPSTAQDILHAVNMMLLGMKAPAHLRLTRLKYNERGNLTGLTTAQTTAEAMIVRFKESILKVVLRFDPEITEITANQQWIRLKAHGVELSRYYNDNGLSKIRDEIAAGPSALQLPFTPRWVSGHERMDFMAKNGLKTHSSIGFTVRTATEADRVMKQGLHFGGRFHKVEKFLKVGPDTLCPKCCHWGHTTYGCPTPEKVRCAICAENHLTIDHKCSIVGCQSGKGKYCAKHGHYKCVNCGGKHMANASTCAIHKQAITIARNGRDEWKEREKEYELRNSRPENEDESDSTCGEDTRETSQENPEIDLEVSKSLDMEICESTVPDTQIDNGSTNPETI
ncbi:hypothetical protein EPUL_000244 [Erysiphe pulchra]|uniref:Gag-like protein n=1 Tax=Erysiphe pulchra TaxID=225359 RepID=A0A2S4Q0U7_9PEZI|nr:hypothetical protein EPUL_000244 [Erysiphe pulchra]